METQITTGQKKSFFQNDRLLVCGMLAVYGICILGCVGALFWGVSQRSRTMSANATSTAAVSATEQAMATATAAVRIAKQETYEYIEHFDKITGDWFVGVYDRKYGVARAMIKDGVYIWTIKDSKGYTQAAEFYKDNKIKDFDVYLDTKFVGDSKLVVCHE